MTLSIVCTIACLSITTRMLACALLLQGVCRLKSASTVVALHYAAAGLVPPATQTSLHGCLL
jgi:hypothetical protein